MNVAARIFLAEPRLGGSEETWGTLVSEFPSEGLIAVSTAATVAVPVSTTEAEDGNAPPWRPDDENASELLFDGSRKRRSTILASLSSRSTGERISAGP